jgi:ATP-dependent DNA ligase
MLATSSPPFDDPSWRFEIKWDGVRALAAVANGSWRLWGREGVVYTERYPELESLRRLPAGTMLDGEIVLVRDGHADFPTLMSSRHGRRPRPWLPFFAEPISYVVFDLLYYAGRSVINCPLAERQELMRRLPEVPFVSRCDGTQNSGRAFFRAAVAAGHEGVVAKKLISHYLPNRRGVAWRKIKEKMELPCVVIGYRTGPDDLRDLLMASLVDGALAFVGTVELGIYGKRQLIKSLEASRQRSPAVKCSIPAKWVRPELFCTVRFCGWRPGGAWRDPVFAGWDEATPASVNRRRRGRQSFAVPPPILPTRTR